MKKRKLHYFKMEWYRNILVFPVFPHVWEAAVVVARCCVLLTKQSAWKKECYGFVLVDFGERGPESLITRIR